METAEVVGSKLGLSVDGSMLSNGCVKESDDSGSDSAFNEKLLLDEMDSYWDDLSARLTVSRVVSDSMIKGMVNAIQEEATEKTALKDAEVAVLIKRLRHYESTAGNSKSFKLKLEPHKQKLELFQCSLDAGPELDSVMQLDRLRIAAVEQLQEPHEGAAKNSVSHQQWEEGVQREIGSITLQNLVESLQDEFGTVICAQQSVMDTVLSKNWRKRTDEISSMRQDLDAIYRSVSNFDSGLLVSHRSTENAEEWSNDKKKDNAPWKIVGSKEIGSCNNLVEKSEESGKLTPNDSPQLMHMSKEELIAYFKTEMNKMKRQHELALHEKTEELFRFKRDLLKEKVSSPLHFSKEKDFEMMKKKISELISKLDDLLLENKEVPSIDDGQDISHRMKERIDTFFMENQWVQRLLAAERKEARCVVPQVPTEANLIEEVERLQLAVEEVKMEATIKEEKYKSVLKDLADEIKSDKEGFETVTKIIADNYHIIYRGAIADALLSINPVIAEIYEKKESINTDLQEKKNALCLATAENVRLKQEIASLSALLKEKEKLELENSSQLVKQKEQFDSVCHKLNLYRDNESKQEMIIANMKSEWDLLNGKLGDAIHQIHLKEVEISNINRKLNITSNDLEEMGRQNDILRNNIREKQEQLIAAITKDKEQHKQLESIAISLRELSKTIWDCESRLTQKIETNEARLNLLGHQCSQIKQQGDLLKRKLSWYKERFEARCEDLQKAEIEVDLLGDEIDTLLGLFEKIYMALDHYSPVLQHYPGVVETLKLIRRQMDGEATKSKLS